MKINLNPVTSKLTGTYSEYAVPEWWHHIQQKFCAEHDMLWESQDVQQCLYQPSAVVALAEWLREQGFAARYWQINYPPDDDMKVAYGVHIDDNCQKFVELKLAYS